MYPSITSGWSDEYDLGVTVLYLGKVTLDVVGDHSTNVSLGLTLYASQTVSILVLRSSESLSDVCVVYRCFILFLL